MTESVVRLWCGICGKACGRVVTDATGSRYVGKLSYPASGDLPRVAEQQVAPFADLALLGVTCSSGHFLALDTDRITTDIRSGLRAVTLDAPRRADAVVTSEVQRQMP